MDEQIEQIKQEALAERRRYYREYRAKNKDRIRAINDRYWARKAMKRKEEENAEAAENV